MISQDLEDLVHRAELLYEQKLKAKLESTHADEFVAIEPVSGEFFLGHTLSEAVAAAQRANPNQLVHTLRIGHKTAVHVGN